MDVTPKMKKAMTKDEVALLVDLIQSNPILTSKETNATTNKSKDDSWTSLACVFNARSGSIPRSKDQLKLKWDNLKKTARKRSQQFRMNNLKTGGGKPDFIPHDEMLDKVTSLLGSTCTGFMVPFGGDGIGDGGGSMVLNVGGMAEVSVQDIDKASHKNIIENVALNDATNTLSNVPEDSAFNVIAETPSREIQAKKKRKIDVGESKSPSAHSLKHFFGMPMSQQLSTDKKGKKKADVQASIVTRNLAIASYYDKKKEKLELEIKHLKLELAEKENNILKNNDI